MQLIQKYVIVLSGLVVFLFLGYTAIQHPDSSQVDGIKTNAPISQSGIETDTGKRIETFANSGTSWGMSPFGIGKPLEEEKKLEFKKPNTEWKTRTLSGITYVFGEGNPRKVMPKFENFQGWDRNGYFDSDTVRPKTESLLLEFLSNPMLPYVINHCGPLTQSGTSAYILSLGLPTVLFTTDFSMQGMITIDPISGQKVLDRDKMGLLMQTFSEIRDYGEVNVTETAHLLSNQCLNPSDIASMDQLYMQFRAVQLSSMNSSLENRKEVCNDLKIENCNYEN